MCRLTFNLNTSVIALLVGKVIVNIEQIIDEGKSTDHRLMDAFKTSCMDKELQEKEYSRMSFY